MKYLANAILLSCLGFMASCSSQQLTVRSIYSSNHCAPVEYRVEAVSSQQQLDAVITRKPKTFLNRPEALPQVDFTRQSIILVALGEKSTLGYALSMHGQQAVLKGGQLRLPVSIIEPAKNDLQGQVIIRPCQILALPKVSFTEIVLD